MLIIRRNTLIYGALVVIFVLFGIAVLDDFTLLDLLYASSRDGFIAQLRYIEYEYTSEDSGLLSQFNAHIIRWVIYYPFIQFGLHDYVYYALYLLPLAYALSQRNMLVVLIILLVMPFGLSFRSGLAAVGLTSVYMALLMGNRLWLFVFGTLLCIFSSATVLQAVLFVCYIWFKRGLKWLEIIPVVILIYFLTVGVIDKVSGALLGEAGYVVSGGGSSNIFVSYVMRSTIIVSFLHNNPRAYVYLALLIALVAYFLRLLLKRGEISGLRKAMLICLIPGFALEGLGVVAAMPVVVWVLMKRYWDIPALPEQRTPAMLGIPVPRQVSS